METHKRYADFIKMQDFLPVYDITAEQSAIAWKSFIPTNQFNDLLQRSLKAITSVEPSKRRSLWVRGTFGTGKSHASAVVKHLLYDDFEAIKDYCETIQDASLREQVKALRRQKHYFPVVIKGVEGAYDVPRFKLSLQRETIAALRKAGYDNIMARSEFQIAISYIEEHPAIIDDVIERDIRLKAIASDSVKLMHKLKNEDIETYMCLDRALSEQHIILSANNISDWLVEIEQEIERRKIADGLIIFWDEFTSVMDTIKSDRINVLQNIAEKSQHSNLFLFLISHRVEFDIDAKDNNEKKKMNDRFDTIDYRMDEVSTYRIMSHTFQPDDTEEFCQIRSGMTNKMVNLMNYLCDSNNEEKASIKKLFPLHPYTAYLCSRMSDWIGSANRSVIRFMNDDERGGFKAFIEDEYTYEQGILLTADRLWDFFLPSFENDTRCGIYVITYNTYFDRVKEQGSDYLRVFKAILLLNALSVGFDKEGTAKKVVPNVANIRMLYAGDCIVEPNIENILRYLDENAIVNKNVMDEYKIAASSYSPAEMQNAKQEIESEYKLAEKFIQYNLNEYSAIWNKMDCSSGKNPNGLLNRPCDVRICSCENDEFVLRSVLNKSISSFPNKLHVAIFYALTEESRELMRNKLQNFSNTVKNIILILPEEVLGEKARQQFITALTGFKVAKTHYNENEASDNNQQALKHIENWMIRVNNGTYRLYFGNDQYSEGTMNNVYKLINEQISFKIFSHGFEQVPHYRDGSVTDTFFKTGGANALIKQIMEAPNRTKMTSFTSSNKPARYVFEFGGNNLIDESCQLTDYAENGDSWIAEVCRKVDHCMDYARKQYTDRFSLSEVLEVFIKPPYGFFQTPACYAALTFALRKHREKLFVPSTSQTVSADKMEDMIAELFKNWQEGNSGSNNKLLLRFGSKEEGLLGGLLKEIFALHKVSGVREEDIKNLGMAKWAIQEFCKTISQRPLWAVKYTDDSDETERDAIEKLITVLVQENPTQDKIKAVVPLLDKNKVDLHDLLSNPELYVKGFDRFISEKADIKEEWKEELMTQLKHNLPEETAFWTESDVEIQLLKFEKRKNNPQPTTFSPTPSPVESTIFPSAPTIVQPTSQQQEDFVRNAKKRVSTIRYENYQWQLFLSNLIDDHPELANYIISKL